MIYVRDFLLLSSIFGTTDGPNARDFEATDRYKKKDLLEEGKRPPHPQDFSLSKRLTRKTARFTKG